MELRGKIVLVTGASSGIGRAVAEAAAERGAHPVLLARTESDLQEVRDGIVKAGGEATVAPVDLSSIEEVKQAAEEIRREVGVPDVLVNNAGVGEWLAIDEGPFELARETIEVPYLAAYYVTRAFIREFLERDRGTIVNVTTLGGYGPIPGATAYNVSRMAMRYFTRALRTDLRETEIRVQLVVPGVVKTPYFEKHPRAARRLPSDFAGRADWKEPEEVAELLLDGVEDEDTHVYTSLLVRFMCFFATYFPGLYSRGIERTGWSRLEGDPTPALPEEFEGEGD